MSTKTTIQKGTGRLQVLLAVISILATVIFGVWTLWREPEIAPNPGPPEPRTASLQPPIRNLASAAWVTHNNEDILLVAERFQARKPTELHYYSLDGQRLEASPSTDSISKVTGYTDHRYLIEYRSGELAFSRNLLSSPSLRLLPKSIRSTDGQIDKFFGWTATDSALHGFADIHNEQDWFSGVVSLLPSIDDNYRLYHLMEYQASPRNLHILQYPLFTTLENESYILDIGESLGSYFESPGVYWLPEQPWQVPRQVVTLTAPKLEIPTPDGNNKLAKRMTAFENLSLPAALYGVAGNLFILIKCAREQAGTAWYLNRFDRNGTELGMYKLPTNAPHLTLVPSEAFWAIIEQGTLQEKHLQVAQSLRVVPHNEIVISGAEYADPTNNRIEELCGGRTTPDQTAKQNN